MLHLIANAHVFAPEDLGVRHLLVGSGRFLSVVNDPDDISAPGLTVTDLDGRRLIPGFIDGHAHITGGGLTENTPRMCPDTLTPRIDRDAWSAPDVFRWLQETGNIAEDEMHRTFNMGIGMVFAVAPEDADAAMERLKTIGEQPVIIGDLAGG